MSDLYPDYDRNPGIGPDGKERQDGQVYLSGGIVHLRLKPKVPILTQCPHCQTIWEKSPGELDKSLVRKYGKAEKGVKDVHTLIDSYHKITTLKIESQKFECKCCGKKAEETIGSMPDVHPEFPSITVNLYEAIVKEASTLRHSFTQVGKKYGVAEDFVRKLYNHHISWKLNELREAGAFKPGEVVLVDELYLYTEERIKILPDKNGEEEITSRKRPTVVVANFKEQVPIAILGNYSRKKKRDKGNPDKDYTMFFLDEFHIQKKDIVHLCAVIQNDDYGLHTTTQENTIDWLNELLTLTDLYEKMTSKKQTLNISTKDKDIKTLAKLTKEYRNNFFDDLDTIQQKRIKQLNRLIIELIYPQETPKMQESTESLLRDYFSQFSKDELLKIEYVVIDMSPTLKYVINSILPHAYLIIDPFHVGARMLNKYFEEVVNSTKRFLTLDDNEYQEIKRVQSLLDKNQSNLTEKEKIRLNKVLAKHSLLKKAYWLKEDFFNIYKCNTEEEARYAFQKWVDVIPKDKESLFKPFLNYAITIEKTWKTEFLNYFKYPTKVKDKRPTNGYIESLNKKIRQEFEMGKNFDSETLAKKILCETTEIKPLRSDSEKEYKEKMKQRQANNLKSAS